MQQGGKVAGVDHGNGFFFGNHALVNKVAGNLERSMSGTLAVTGLEHIELAVLNGEFHILHITVVVFKGAANVFELFKSFGELFRHLADGHRSTNTGNDVLALSIGKELAHKVLFAGGRVAGKGNTGAAIVAHVAEYHYLHVNSGAPRIWNIVVTAVNVRAGVVPAAENGFDSADKLLFGVGGEVCADFVFVFGFELGSKLFKVVRSKLNVKLDSTFCFHFVDKLLEIFFADFHNNVGVHLDKAAIAVPSPTGVIGLFGHNFDNLLVKTEVQDGVHHAGHRSSCAGTNGNEKRVFKIAEFLAGNALKLFDVFHNFRHDFIVNLATVLIVLGAGFGGDGKALGNGKTDVGHLCKVGALAAEKLTHLCIAFREKVNKLFAHIITS